MSGTHLLLRACHHYGDSCIMLALSSALFQALGQAVEAEIWAVLEEA
jgi:hypothetical protein